MMRAAVVLVDPWSSVLGRLGDLGRGLESGALNLALVLVIMLAGWLVAAIVSRLVIALLRALKFDHAMGRVFGARGAGGHEPARLAGWAVYWLTLASAAVVALDALGLHVGDSVSGRLATVLPGIVTSAVLFAVGSLIALLAGAITRRILETAHVRAARFQGQVVAAVLTAFAALLALEQVGFAAQFVIWVGIVAVAAAGLALALAFGLGCRELARDFLVEYLRSLDDERVSRPE